MNNIAEFIDKWSQKFIKRITLETDIQYLQTPDFGWSNNRYKSDYFRLAHVEHYYDNQFTVLHVTLFPVTNCSTYIFGFDVVCSNKKNEIMAGFLDLSPIGFTVPITTKQFKTYKKVPNWGDIFSKYFIIIKPDYDEYNYLFDLAYEKFSLSLQSLKNRDNFTTDNKMIELISQRQDKYCNHQQQNKQTFGVLKSKLGEDKAKKFMKYILFPNTTVDLEETQKSQFFL